VNFVANDGARLVFDVKDKRKIIVSLGQLFGAAYVLGVLGLERQSWTVRWCGGIMG
jgi:hypothetical protein